MKKSMKNNLLDFYEEYRQEPFWYAILIFLVLITIMLLLTAIVLLFILIPVLIPIFIGLILLTIGIIKFLKFMSESENMK